MRLVHFADTHLGFRQFLNRTTAAGINQREADVAIAFRRAIDITIQLRPELVVVAGDVFDAPKPSTNHATLHAFREFGRLREELPDSDVVIIAGNHDTPRTTETGSILPLFATLGIRVVLSQRPERIRLRDGELSVFAIPNHMRPLPELEPDPSARRNVLLMHDKVEGIINAFGPTRLPEGDVAPADLHADRWDYVALGDYHVFHSVAPNAFFSGATEYSSSNIWGEVDKEKAHPEHERGKGLIEWDLETASYKFHRIESARAIVDLPAIDATGKTAAEISDEILAAAAAIDDQVVRQTINNIPKHVVRDLDHRKIRDLKGRALNYQLDTRQPEEKVEETIDGMLASIETTRKRSERVSIPDYVRNNLETRELTPGIDRAALVELGMGYLAAVEEKLAATATTTETAPL